MEAVNCEVCQAEMGIQESDGPPGVCESCTKKYPPALLKAVWDCFDYALGLRDGRVLRFSSAKIHNEWVTISGMWDIGDEHPIDKAFVGFPCPRGIDIRLSEIIWVADAPEGS